MAPNPQVRFAIPPIVRRRAENLGAEGVAWLADVEDDVQALASEWSLTLGCVLSGGSEALVVEAIMPGGQRTVLKIGLPGSESGRQEARVLAVAAGRGYARLIRHDYDRRAMLLERLGLRLESYGLPVDEQIRIICAMLKSAWHSPPDAAMFMNGAEKADSLASFIMEAWEALDRPCSERTVDCALRFAEQRRLAFTPSASVLAHGDGHAANTLRVPGPGPRRFKFIDPDGLFIEPAYDLGNLMRGWSAPLLAGDTLALGWQRAHLLARFTGVDPQPTWEWGFIERVSTGLAIKQLGEDEEAAEYLAVADIFAKSAGA